MEEFNINNLYNNKTTILIKCNIKLIQNLLNIFIELFQIGTAILWKGTYLFYERNVSPIKPNTVLIA